MSHIFPSFSHSWGCSAATISLALISVINTWGERTGQQIMVPLVSLRGSQDTKLLRLAINQTDSFRPGLGFRTGQSVNR